jgi:DNA-binding transcriptional ArsR family regulator
MAKQRGRDTKPRARLDAVFSALADPTRRTILERLSEGEATVSELAEPFDVSLPAISRHLRVLAEAGLITRRKDGKLRHCRLVEDPLRDAIGWIVHYGAFWEERLDSLEAILARRTGRASR